MKGLCSLVLTCIEPRQTFGVFMGTSPAPELANNFAFWHEYEFLSHMVDEYKQIGPSRYSTHFNSLTNLPRGLSGVLTIYLLYLLGICLVFH